MDGLRRLMRGSPPPRTIGRLSPTERIHNTGLTSPLTSMDLQLRNDHGVDAPLTPDDEFLGVAVERSLGDSVFDAIPDAIIIIDRTGTIDRVNPATLELTGFAADDLVGRPISTLTRRDRVFNRIFAQTLSGRTSRYETRCTRKDGSRFPVSSSTSRSV